MPDNTKSILADSLKNILIKKPFSKISIQDITDECGLSRKTFYYHFHDKYELVKWIYDEDVLPLISDDLKYSNWNQLLYRLLEYFYRNNNFYKHLVLQQDYTNELSSYFSDITHGVVKEIVDDACKNIVLSKKKREFLISYYRNAFGGTIIDWLSSEDPIQPQELINMMYDITSGSLSEFIRKNKNFQNE